MTGIYDDTGGTEAASAVPRAAQAAAVDGGVRLYAAYSRASSWVRGCSYEEVVPDAGTTQRFVYAAATAELTGPLALATEADRRTATLGFTYRSTLP